MVQGRIHDGLSTEELTSERDRVLRQLSGKNWGEGLTPATATMLGGVSGAALGAVKGPRGALIGAALGAPAGLFAVSHGLKSRLERVEELLNQRGEEVGGYRKEHGVMLDREIPVVRLPQGDDAKSALLQAVRATKQKTWTHPQIAVPVEDLNLTEMGFKSPTRTAVPLPGESLGTPSWRAGRLHAHKSGPFYLIHEDEKEPVGIRQIASHLIHDTPRSVLLRLSGAARVPVKEADGFDQLINAPVSVVKDELSVRAARPTSIKNLWRSLSHGERRELIHKLKSPMHKKAGVGGSGSGSLGAGGAVDTKGLRKGDILVMSLQPAKDPSHIDKFFDRGTKAVQGGLTHAAMYVGNGQIVESRIGEGVKLKHVDVALKGKSFVALRPKLAPSTRRRAAKFVKAQVGKPYDQVGLIKTTVGMFLPESVTKRLDYSTSKDREAWVCANLITAAYDRARLTSIKGILAPADLRISPKMKEVKRIVVDPTHFAIPTMGRLSGVSKVAATERRSMTDIFNGVKDFTLPKDIGTSATRGGLAGLAGGALSAPLLTGGALLTMPTLAKSVGVGGINGVLAGASLGALYDLGKRSGRTTQLNTNRLGYPGARLKEQGTLDRKAGDLVGKIVGKSTLETVGRGAVLGALLGGGLLMHRGMGAMNVAKGVGFGALKGSLAGGGLGAIVDMGRNAGKKEELQKLLEMRAEGKLGSAEKMAGVFAENKFVDTPFGKIHDSDHHYVAGFDAYMDDPVVARNTLIAQIKKAPKPSFTPGGFFENTRRKNYESDLSSWKRTRDANYLHRLASDFASNGDPSVFKGKTAEHLTPATIHRLADRVGVKWDNDPKFMENCKRWVGKGHLDDMSPVELEIVASHLQKTAVAPSHIFVTGHSGAGKTTKAHELSKQTGLPVLALDDAPEIAEYHLRQKAYSKQTGQFEMLGDEEKEALSAVMQRISALKTPHIIEGAHFLAVPHMIPHNAPVVLVDRPKEQILQQRVEREEEKRKLEGKPSDPEGTRIRGEKLHAYYAPGFKVISERPMTKMANVSKEKKEASNRVGRFFKQEDPTKKWDSFTDQAARKSFVNALANDPRADEKLKLHADRMNRLINGKPIETVQGSTGKYTITRLRGGEIGCTCADWRYKKSVAPLGQTDCKHITEWKAHSSSQG